MGGHCSRGGGIEGSQPHHIAAPSRWHPPLPVDNSSRKNQVQHHRVESQVYARLKKKAIQNMLGVHKRVSQPQICLTFHSPASKSSPHRKRPPLASPHRGWVPAPGTVDERGYRGTTVDSAYSGSMIVSVLKASDRRPCPRRVVLTLCARRCHTGSFRGLEARRNNVASSTRVPRVRG